MATATAANARAADERGGPETMEWFLLEAAVALVLALVIVGWTMGPKRRKPPRGTTNDAGNGPPR
jgi:hypothetical protein